MTSSLQSQLLGVAPSPHFGEFGLICDILAYLHLEIFLNPEKLLKIF